MAHEPEHAATPQAGLISEEVYARENALCRQLSRGQGGCNWGKCAHCGVIPLLRKLRRGELLESSEEAAAARRETLEN